MTKFHLPVAANSEYDDGQVYADAGGDLCVKLKDGGLFWLRSTYGSILEVDETIPDFPSGNGLTAVRASGG